MRDRDPAVHGMGCPGFAGSATSGPLTPAPAPNEHRSASKAPHRSIPRGTPRDRTHAARPAFPRSATAVREAHRRPPVAAHPRREGRFPAPVRAGRRAAGRRRLPHRSGGPARRRLDGSGDGVPAGRRPGRDLEPGAGAPGGRGGVPGGPRDARPGRARRPQRLGPDGEPAAPPPVGPQRGGLLRGSAAHLRDRHRLHPRPARRPSGALAHGARPQALARAQQRDRPRHLLQLGPPARAARVRPACLPRHRRGGRGGRGDAGVQPGQRPPQPRVAVPARAVARLDRTGAAGLLGRGRTVQPGRLRALLRHPRGGHRGGAARRCRQFHRPRHGQHEDRRARQGGLGAGPADGGRRRHRGPAAALGAFPAR
ncbi:hypothetical protein SGRIM128S_05032 [Streptomyces griseomycini]